MLALALVVSQVSAAAYDVLPKGFQEEWESLLHYAHGKSTIEAGSSFFLSSVGHVSPEAELIATLKAFQKGDRLQCQYPARHYLLTGQWPSATCEAFREYQTYVSSDRVYLVFASESETSPVSSMGHVFLVLEGPTPHAGVKRHAIGFVADTSENASLLMGFLTDQLVGRYVLMPYRELIDDYVIKERRSVWAYELSMTAEERRRLFLHLFELKAHKIKYSFFQHNCATGLNRVLATASTDFRYPKDQYWVTPAEYAFFVNQTGRVQAASVIPSHEDAYRLAHQLPLNPLETPKTSRLGVRVGYDDQAGWGGAVTFLPFSTDIYEVNPSKTGLSEIKFGEVVLKTFDRRAWLDEVTLVNIRSIPSMAISSLKPNFGIQLHGDVDAHHTSLHPDVHVGTAFSWGETGIRPFASVDVGVLGDHQVLGYALGECGVFVSGSTFGLMSLSVGRAWSTGVDYRGFKENYRMSYSIPVDKDLFFDVKGAIYDKKRGHVRQCLTFGLNIRF